MNVKVIGADSSKTTAALGKDLLVVASPARLFELTAFNDSAGTVYLQVFDAAAEPPDTTSVPKLVVPIATKATAQLSYKDGSIFGVGIYVCFSSTSAAKTKVVADTGLIDVTYRLMA